jgi:hypothetical protein
LPKKKAHSFAPRKDKKHYCRDAILRVLKIIEVRNRRENASNFGNPLRFAKEKNKHRDSTKKKSPKHRLGPSKV